MEYLHGLSKRMSQEIPPFTPPEINLPGACVLVIEDDPNVRETLREILVDLGYRCFVAPDGKTGIETYEQHQEEVNLALVDYAMDEMDGGETYRRLKAVNPALRMILTSGYTCDGDIQNLMNEGVDAFLKKPFLIQDLVRTIEGVLNK